MRDGSLTGWMKAVPWGMLIVCLLLGQAVAVLALVDDLSALRAPSVRLLAFVAPTGLAAAGWLFLGAWSWRWVLARRNTDRGRRIFWWGVVLFGGSLGISSVALHALRMVGGAANVLSLPFLREFLIQVAIYLPMIPWAGWLWGGTMMFTLGALPPQPRDPAASGPARNP